MPRQLPTPNDSQTFADLDPDLILPEQFFPVPEPTWSGEVTLLWTVFSDGIDAFRREVLRNHEYGELWDETVDWIWREGDDSLFSFDYLCEVFDLHPRWVRGWLFSWRDRQVALRQARLTETRVAA